MNAESAVKNQFRFFVATRNQHKLHEIADILKTKAMVVGLAELPGAPVTLEDRPTFTGNAAKKASELAAWLAGDGAKHVADPAFARQFVLADDSGLEVDALNGTPGVHSARFAALDAEEPAQQANSTDEANNKRLLHLLERVPMERRRARFRCVLAIIEFACGDKLPATQVFEGSCEGHIDFEPRGAGGFGYDPLFVPDGFDQSFAQLGADVKNRISHRSRALEKLRAWIESQ